MNNEINLKLKGSEEDNIKELKKIDSNDIGTINKVKKTGIKYIGECSVGFETAFVKFLIYYTIIKPKFDKTRVLPRDKRNHEIRSMIYSSRIQTYINGNIIRVISEILNDFGDIYDKSIWDDYQNASYIDMKNKKKSLH